MKNILRLTLFTLLFVVGFTNANELLAQTVTFDQETTNLNTGTLTGYTNNLAVYGFKITVTGAPENIGTVNIKDGVANNLANIFTNGRLYKTSTSGYNAGNPGTLVGTVTFGSSLITISGINDNIAAGDTRYYYLVVDCIATTNGAFQPFIGYGQSPVGIISTGGTNYNNNNNGYENYYTIAAGTPPPVIMSKLTSGITSNANNIVPSQANAVVFGFSLTTNANRTFTQFNIGTTSNALASYVASAVLYSNTTNNYATGTKTAVGTATIGSTYITVNTAGEAVNNTTKFYFLVVTFSSGFNPVPTTLQFNFMSGQSNNALTQSGGTTFNNINVLGDTYNLNSTNLTIAALTGGLTSGTITAGQTGLVLFGFSATSTSNITVSGFNINSTNPNMDTYFGSAKLYRNTTNTYASGTKTLIGTVTLNGGYAQVTGLTEAITTTAKFYFLVADNIDAVTPTETIAFNFTSGQTSDAVVQSVPVASGYNTYTISGNTLTLPEPTAILTGLNSPGTNNITTNISPGSSNVAVFGFKVKSYGAVTIDKFNILFSSGSQNTFFSNGRLIESTDEVYDAGDLTNNIGAVTVSSASNANIGDATPMGLTLNGNTRNFFLVVDVNVYNNTGTPSTSNYAFTTSQSPTAIVYGSPYSIANPPSNITGATLNFPAGNNTFIWTGNSSTVLSFSSNWAGFAAPTLATNDIVIPGSRPNYPKITANYAIGNVTFSGTGASFDLNGFAFSPQSITLATNATATFTGTGGVGSITPTAGITLNPGSILNVSAPITMPNATAGSISNAGTIALTGAANFSVPNANAPGASTNTGTISQAGTGTLSFTGNFTNAGTIIRSSSGTFGISGTLNNSGTITKSGTGVTTFTGAVTNTSTGVITNSGASGAMNFSSTLANSGTLELSGAAPVTVTGVITSASGADITNSGTGTLTLTANITNPTGATITQSSTGPIAFSGTLTNAGTITQTGTGTITAASTLTNNSGGVITLGGGPVTITGVVNNASGGSFNLGTAGTKDFNGVATFTNAGAMTMSGGTANIVATTFANSGTFTSSGGTVTFDKAGAQAINNSNNATPVSFYNLTLTGSNTKTLGSTGVFEINSVGTVTLTSNITFAAGTAKLTLNSDANGSTSVAVIPTGASITGTVNAERYITGNSANSRGYRLLSSPVSVANGTIYPNLTYAQAKAYTTGTGGATNGFDAAGNPTIYFYRENMAPNTSTFISGNYRGVSKINNTPASTFSFDGGDANASLPAGNGYLFFFRGDKATTANPTVTTSIAKPTTITALGVLNQGNIIVKPWFTGLSTLSYTAATPTTVRGFNLVGNPYASSIDWDLVTKTNVSTIIWIYNPLLKVYATYNSAIPGGAGTNFNGPSGTADIIPSGQGFFVKASNASAALTFNESNKVSAQVPASNLLLAGTPGPVAPIQYARVQLFQDSLNNEDALIFFNSAAKTIYVEDEDADYLKGNSTVNISTRSSDNIDLAINQVPYPTAKTTLIIPLNINVTSSGSYQIKLTELKDIPQLYTIWLKDSFTQDSTDIKNSPFYTFNADVTNAATFGRNRFTLVIGENKALAYKLLTFTAAKLPTSVKLDWTTQNEANYTTFTVERSTDGGTTYTMLGTVQSSGIGSYSLTDPSPNLLGQNLYRLKAEDVGFVVSYSAIVPVNYSITNTNPDNSPLSVYPIPSSTTINVSIQFTTLNTIPSYTIKIIGSSGDVVKTVSSNLPTWQGDISAFKPGLYFIQVYDEKNKKLVGKTKFIKI